MTKFKCVLEIKYKPYDSWDFTNFETIYADTMDSLGYKVAQYKSDNEYSNFVHEDYFKIEQQMVLTDVCIPVNFYGKTAEEVLEDEESAEYQKYLELKSKYKGE